MIIEWYAFSGTRTRANCLEGNYDTLSPRMLDEKLAKIYTYKPNIKSDSRLFSRLLRMYLCVIYDHRASFVMRLVPAFLSVGRSCVRLCG